MCQKPGKNDNNDKMKGQKNQVLQPIFEKDQWMDKKIQNSSSWCSFCENDNIVDRVL